MPQAEMVDVFEGLRYARDLTPSFSPRGPLDTPRELLNAMHNEHGQLWVPPAAADIWYSFGAGTTVRHITNVAGVNIGTAMIVQVDSKVYVVDTGVFPAAAVEVIADVGSERIWVNAMDTAIYVGTQDNTWKIVRPSPASGTPTATALGAAVPHGFHSYSYQGRRFVLRRQTTISFSGINQPETFDPDDTFTVGGDQTGGSWTVHPGSLVAALEHEDILLLFLTQSVWALTGNSPQNFRLRRTNALHGCWARDTIVRTDQGILFLGGTPNGEMGVRVFTGNQSIPVSNEIDSFFRAWTTASGDFMNANRRFTAVKWKNRYILSARGPDADRQVYVYDLDNRKWSTFGGWSQGPGVSLVRLQKTGPGLDRLMLTNGKDLYVTALPMVRAPSAPDAKVKVGWHDQGRPSGHVRFLGAKVGLWGDSLAKGTSAPVDQDPPPAAGTPFITSLGTANGVQPGGDSSVGWAFTVDAELTATALRAFMPEAGTRTVRLWRADDSTLLASATVAAVANSWESAPIPDTILQVGSTYVVVVDIIGTTWDYYSSGSTVFDTRVNFLTSIASNTGAGETASDYPTSTGAGPYVYGAADVEVA